MIIEYKHQHWLPASYLQFFSSSGTPSGRDSVIYVTDSEKSSDRRVKNVAFANFLYSRVARRESEERFQPAESGYPALLKRALSGATLAKSERMQLFYIMLDLHFRNPAYKNQSSAERIDAAEWMARSFLIQRVAGMTESESQELEPVVDRIFDRWELSRIEAPSTVNLWTSDHPSILFSLGDQQNFAFVILPVSPANVLIGFRRDLVDVDTSQMTEDDARALNTYQVLLCTRELYSSSDQSEKVGPNKPLSCHLENRPTERGWVSDDGYNPEVVSYPHDDLALSFLSIRGAPVG